MTRYPYLIGCILFLLVWSVVYQRLKDDRRDMLMISLLFGAIGLTTPFLFCYDWWQPQTLLGKFLSIEDFLLGFTNGSLAIMIHRTFFREKSRGETEYGKLFLPFLMIFVVTSALFYGFKMSSFYANFCGLLASSIYVLYKRIELISVGMMSGLAMAAVSMPIYLALIRISPDWITTQWLTANLSGVMIVGVPIEDIVWYFLIGFCLSLIYPFYKNIYYEKLCR